MPIRRVRWHRPERWLLIARATVLLIVSRAVLQFLPFSSVRRLLGLVARVGEEIEVDCSGSSRAVWAVRTADCYLHSSCLVRALAACILLARERRPARLCIGVRQGEGGRLEAHAWVECAGRIVLGQRRDLSEYTPLISVPAGLVPEAAAPPVSR